jgi:predicted esterase
MRRLALIPLLLALGCAGDIPDEKSHPHDSGSGDADTDDSGTDTDGGDVDDSPAYAGALPSGEYLLGFAVAPVNNLLVPFQAVVTPTPEGERPGIASLTLAPVNAAFDIGEIVTTVTDIRVEEDGTFSIDLGTFVLPGAYAPTGSDVELAAVLSGALGGEGGFCGDMAGEILTFGISLEGSSFGSVPWTEREEGASISCSADEEEELPRITDCPTLAAGTVEGFESGGVVRSFELVMPDGVEPEAAAPLVFAFHGLGGGPYQFLESHPLQPAAAAMGAILVVPEASELGGTLSWDPYSNPATNKDVVFFDDMLTCVSEQFAVDPDRVHAMGFSNGGLMTGQMLTLRSNVLASAAPFSGGLGQAFPDDARAIPTLMTWGGPDDVGSGTDFALLADEMQTVLTERSHPLVVCEHDRQHEIDDEWWPWVMRFFADHPRTEAGAPYEAGLPEVFPDWCAVPAAG